MTNKEINMLLAEKLFGIDVSTLAPHDWERGYFTTCRRCGKRRGHGRLSKNFINECRITTDGSIIKDYCSNAMSVLKKLLLNKYVYNIIFETAGTMFEITAKRHFKNDINVVGNTINVAICLCAIECLKE